ncbi:MAG: tetratricopeptide repeat protein [Saprospiraceae bacterium]
MGEQQIKSLLKLAKRAYQKRDLDNALGFSKHATELASLEENFNDWGDLYAIRGKIKGLQGHYLGNNDDLEEAIECLNTAKVFFLYTAPLCIKVGQIFLFQKKHEAAFELFKNALRASRQAKIKDDEIHALLQISEYYLETRNLPTSTKYLVLAQQLLNNKTLIENWILYYQISMTIGIRQHNFEEVETNANKVLALCVEKNDIENEVKALNAKGISFAIRGDYKQAFENLWLANDKSQLINFRLLTARTLINIGNIFSSLYNYEEAIKQHLKVVNEYVAQIDNYTLTVLCHNIGGTYMSLGQDEKAIYYYLKGLETAEKDGIHKLEAIILYEISKIYADKDLDKALEYIEKTKEVLEAYNIASGIEMHTINLAEIYFKQGKVEDALSKGLESLKLCEKVENKKTLVRVYRLLSSAYKMLEQYKEALKYHELYHELQHKLHQEMRKKQTLDLEIRYETKEKEQQIKLLTTDMELQELELKHTRKVAQQNELITQANQEIKQFTYAVSHDLKEPLRMIGSFTKLIGRKVGQQGDKRLDEYMNYVHDGVQRMEGMLNGMLDYARIGKHTNLQDEIDLNRTIADVLLNLRVRVHESQAVVNCSNLPTIKTNKVLISQLFQNLIGNAIKFSKKDVKPIVNIFSIDEEDRFVLAIEDNGIGIPQKHRDKVFDLFSRLHTRDKYEGSGIGLAMCKKITQILQGEIWIESEDDIGTTFYIAIPKVIEPVVIEELAV